MQVVNIEGFKVFGLNARTNNQDEFTGKTDKISKLWDDAAQNCFNYMLVNGNIYGVYHNYESDVNGNYDLTVGSDKIAASQADKLQEVTVAECKYLKFEATGEMPEACIALWQEIWAYFEINNEYERAYSTDFEKYTQTGIEIYISIK